MGSAFSSPFSFSITATVSRTLYTPFSRTDFTFHSPFTPKGTMIRWVNSPSGTLPTASPAVTVTPGCTERVNDQSPSAGQRPPGRSPLHFFAQSRKSWRTPGFR